jgi:hypothetical protein
MPNRTEARPAKAVLTYATGRLPLLRLFSTPLKIPRWQGFEQTPVYISEDYISEEFKSKDDRAWARNFRLDSLQLLVLRLGLLQDGDVGVGILPEREEILVALA